MAKTFVRGEAITNATSYELYEKSGGNYDKLAENTEINFEVSALGLAGGNHTLVVKAKADGYADSDYSNEVVYIVPDLVLQENFTGYKASSVGWNFSDDYSTVTYVVDGNSSGNTWVYNGYEVEDNTKPITISIAIRVVSGTPETTTATLFVVPYSETGKYATGGSNIKVPLTEESTVTFNLSEYPAWSGDNASETKFSLLIAASRAGAAYSAEFSNLTITQQA